jgi:hypothetical protein
MLTALAQVIREQSSALQGGRGVEKKQETTLRQRLMLHEVREEHEKGPYHLARKRRKNGAQTT